MLQMLLSNPGFLEIASYEGLCLRPYYDSVGVTTIGFGATVSDIPDLAKWPKDQYISIQQAIQIYRNSLTKYEETVNEHLKIIPWQYQFDALVSICYNIGQFGFSHSTFLNKINNNSDLNSIKNSILLWDKPPEILRRREREANLYVNGNYSNNGTTELIDTDGKGHQLIKTAKDINLNLYI